ncbi:hypothetical protein DCM75_03955 [Bradyrhizobium sp. WBOS02]|uniref:Uncharacterized protein n=1 Tax=Bradyrhizobium betae TaxID=244734 RepID=A0AAE9STT8_9BRAD|nr:hypothetical protein DCK84_07835 [Bradyrhizobium sp. WBOS01]UUO39985.1 hypothetical protein DCM75_03955 [Bradyrhizobium sp. WBOS02]UUO52176.1 hypothetical protein DCM79_03740 [Bradyrhizobium sp. WBOS07]UUO65191.1 hypothetical protein DCM83_08160 [Bradyrhizobium betae]
MSPHPSLRAQRSNPDCLRGKILDCFAALAMTAFEVAASVHRLRLGDDGSHIIIRLARCK